MKNGQCPKCNSATVHSQTGGVFYYNPTLHVHTGSMEQGVAFVSYICTTCGYFENYVIDPNKLAKVAATWPQVPVS
jgi:predicted nucleic-acid-binding Zn-ribbon protein